MIVCTSASRSFQLVEKVGVAIMNAGGGQLHSAFLFRIDQEPAHLLHLAWHHVLCCAPEGQHSGPDERYMWANLAELDAENRRVLAGFLSTLGTLKPPVPYGFRSEGIDFDMATGKLRPHPEGRGVTCATFLLTILKIFGFFPINEETWPTNRPGDADWQQQIVDLLRVIAPEHAEAVRNDLTCARFRPEEVVGAVATAGWPHNFAEALVAGTDVLSDMRGAGKLA